ITSKSVPHSGQETISPSSTSSSSTSRSVSHSGQSTMISPLRSLKPVRYPLIIFRFFHGAGQEGERCRPKIVFLRKRVVDLDISRPGDYMISLLRKRPSVLAGVLLVAVASALAAAQTESHVDRASGTTVVDSRIATALQQVSPDRIRANIEKLVSFGTRSTISAQDSGAIQAGRGVGAARQWIQSEFERYSRDCGGCLDVKTDSFTQPTADRIPRPTEITNVYAVLKGSDAENAKRIVLVTGHYDSRNSDILDVKGDAPGANDDASGTAVSLECARVLSKLKFPATIIFLTVAGEEQGLNGSRHFAKMAKEKMAKEQGWNVEAVLNNDIVGGDKSAEQDNSQVRVFSEGLPAAATEQEIRRIRGLGGENDSESRQLARYIADVGHAYDPGVKPMLVFRLDRYLR